MTTSYLRPLTLTAVATLLMTAPLAGTAPSTTAQHTDGDRGPSVRTSQRLAATPLPTAGLPTGARPRIPFAHASRPAFLGGNFRLHRVDGTTIPLHGIALGQWSAMGRGAIGVLFTEVGPELQQVDAAGKVVRERVLDHDGLGISPDHSIVSWLDDRRRPHDLEGRGTREFTFSRVPQGDSVATVSGARTCKEQAPEGGGCTIFVNAAGHQGTFISTSHGIVDRIGPMLHVVDVNQRGRVTGLVSRATSTTRACWGVFTVSGHRAWKTCRYRLGAFSTDGRRVLAERTQARWDSVNRFAFLRHDGSVARAYTFDPGPRRSLTRLTWEDSTHLLGVLRAGGTWSIVRIGVGGAVEYAVRPKPAVNEFSPFTLPVR